jgi:hypothetical protein
MEFREMDGSTVNHVVNHIFLPIKLPQKDDKPDAQGGTFVRLVADVLALVEVEVEELKETKAMMKSWGMVQQDIMDWKAVHRNIEPGKTCAIFLAKQNAGLTVSIPADDSTSATLAVFRVAARSSAVMGAPGDLSGTFPGWCVTTHANRVRNSSFAEQVADLANHTFEEMAPRSRKAGSSHAEIRDVVDARYIVMLCFFKIFKVTTAFSF